MKKKDSKKRPGDGLRILSYLPAINWIALICVGFQNSSTFNVTAGVLYGILTFAVPKSAAILWIVSILQFALVSRSIQKRDRQSAPPPSEPLPGPEPRGESAASEPGFASIVLPGDEERGQAIPARPSATHAAGPSADARDGGATHAKFIRDMQKYASQDGAASPFVPFKQYWPTYDSMNRQQRAWYFYWRSQARRQNYLDTDLSYIFVHVYELLSGVGWSAAEDGYHQLTSLWTAYRATFPQLDRYLSDWTFDFALLHGLKCAALPDGQLPDQMAARDVLIGQHSQDKPLKLPFALIDALCDYSLTGSKFYKDGHQALMQEAIPRIVALADAASLKKDHRGILAAYGPASPRKQRICAFQSAVCPDANRWIDLSVKAYTSSQRLRSYINELVRFGENTRRALYGSRGRLRGVALDEETARLVKAFLEKEYAPSKAAPEAPAQNTQVQLNFDSIDALRTQSDAVRDALEVPGEAAEKPLLTDLREVSALLAELSPEAERLLDQLRGSGWECPYLPEMSDSVGEINRLAGKYLACALLARERAQLIVEDDYRDELDHLYANRPGAARAPSGGAGSEAPAPASGVQQLTGTLTPTQRRALQAILWQEDVSSALGRIAEEAMTLPEILIDEINDAASQFLDDILVDALEGAPRILEQYESELRENLKQEEDHGSND